jgi:hypothetical protein
MLTNCTTSCLQNDIPLFKFLHFHSYSTFNIKLSLETVSKSWIICVSELKSHVIMLKTENNFRATHKLNVTIEHMALLLLTQERPGSNLCRVLTDILPSFLRSVQANADVWNLKFPQRCSWVVLNTFSLEYKGTAFLRNVGNYSPL